MKKKLIAGLATGLFLLGMVGLANATPLGTTVYSNDFDGNSVGSAAWSSTSISTDSHAGFVSTQYRGNYTTAGSTTLTITGLAAHTQMSLDFDLYLFWTWDGNGNIGNGLDYFSLTDDIIFQKTFSNHQSQSYTGSPDEVYGTGATATHVYRDLGITGSDDGFTFAHTGDTFTVTFGGPTTQSDEWWGIDNVKVTTNAGAGDPVPEPATMLLMGTGIAGLVGSRVRRKKKG